MLDSDLPGGVAHTSLDNEDPVVGEVGGDVLRVGGHTVLPREGALHHVQTIIRPLLMLSLDCQHAVVLPHVELVGAVMGDVLEARMTLWPTPWKRSVAARSWPKKGTMWRLREHPASSLYCLRAPGVATDVSPFSPPVSIMLSRMHLIFLLTIGQWKHNPRF